MKSYKLNDIYVLRPMRLVREKRYDKIKFPYNLVCLFKSNSDCYLRLLEDAGKTKSRYVFETSGDIILATKDAQSQYTDIFSGQLYLPTLISDLDTDNVRSEILFSKYIENLATLRCEQVKQEYLESAFLPSDRDTTAYADRYLELMQQYAGIRYEILHSILTTEELKSLQKQLMDLDDIITEITLGGDLETEIKEKTKRKVK